MGQLHRTALDYGAWITGGRDRAGLAAVWPEMTQGEPHKPLRRSRVPDLERIGVCATQPHSEREKPCSKPLTGSIDTQCQNIHAIAVRMPESVQKIIVCLYFRAMPFRDVAMITGMESKDVGRLKARFLGAINTIVR